VCNSSYKYNSLRESTALVAWRFACKEGRWLKSKCTFWKLNVATKQFTGLNVIWSPWEHNTIKHKYAQSSFNFT